MSAGRDARVSFLVLAALEIAPETCPESLSIPMPDLMVHRDTLHDVICRVASGEAAALAELFRRYGQRVFDVAFRLNGSTDDADDVVQDVFVGLPEALRRYADEGKFEAWLTRLTVRVALMRMRRARRRMETPLTLGSVASVELTSPRPEEAIGARITLEHALAQLESPARTIFILKAAEGYTHAEIAELLGISRAASEVRYWRTIRRLQIIIEGSK